MALRNRTARDAHVVTSARKATSLDVSERTKRYLLTMAFRTACFVAMIFVPGVWRLVLLVAGALLPTIAVLLANASDNHRTPADEPEEPSVAALPGGVVIPVRADD